MPRLLFASWHCLIDPASGGSGGGDSDPVVSIQASDPNAAEAGPDLGQFTVSRTGDTSAAITVSYIVGGSASPGTDYQALSGSVVIAAGSSSAAFSVSPFDDALAEGNEFVVATLAPGAGYSVGGPSSATVLIADDSGTNGTDSRAGCLDPSQ